MDYLLGIDLGTGSVKTMLTDERRRSWQATSSHFSIDSPAPGWAEQDPGLWWREVCATVADVGMQAGLRRSDRVTVGFTGQMHSLVLLDEDLQPLRPSILWCDNRAISQAAEVQRKLPGYRKITGNSALPAFTLPQLLWVRENEPDIFARATVALVPKDYLRLRATGRAGTDWTDASGMGLLDSATRAWSSDILDGLHLDRSILPAVHAPHDLAGSVQGLLPAGVQAQAAYGVGDQFAEALSAGLTQPGQISIALGTSAVVLGVVDHPVPGSFCHAPAGRWLRLDSLHAGGMSLTWFRDTFAPGTPISALIQEAEHAPPGSRGLLYLPFLAGERGATGAGTPGGFVGIRREHERSDFVRAILEGVAFELRRMSLDSQDAPATESLVIKGGGARSELWNRIIGAVFQAPARTTTRDAAFGAAMTGGLAAGWWPDYEATVETGVPYLDPVAELIPQYEEHFAAYRGTVAVLGSSV